MINIDECIILLELACNSDIDIYYNEEMGIFPTTIFDGNNDIQFKELIIKKSKKLPKIDSKKTYLEYEQIIKKFCKENSLKIK